MHPILFEIGNFKLESYFTIIAIAIMAGIFFAIKRAKKKNFLIAKFFDFILFTIIGGYIGARVFHVLVELPHYYFRHPIEIFKIWKGGFVLHGALIFALFAGILFLKKNKLPSLFVADIISPPLMLMLAIGRIACFLTGCCYGRETSSWAGLIFPKHSAAPSGILIHPTQLYMSFSALMIMILLLVLEKSKPFKEGSLFAITLILYPLSRFIIEFFRADFRGFSVLGISISQMTSVLFILFGVLLLFKIFTLSD